MTKMHPDEIDIDAALVQKLLAAQFPQWVALPLTSMESAGTDNAMYRLGETMAVRLPRIERAVAQVEKEQRWLPRLAPRLPLGVPVPVGRGKPAEGYPWPWSVYTWLEGENATLDRLRDPIQTAKTLAGFVTALRDIDATGGPPPGEHNFGRGVPLTERDTQTRAAIAELVGTIDAGAALAAWQAALSAPPWGGPPVWIHGDLQSGNLLAQDGRLTAVIDFGGLGVGDPACDYQVAWNLLPPDARAAFRVGVGADADDAAWARGRGWALSTAVIALPYYQETNPTLAGIARTTIEQVLAEHYLST